MVQTVGVHDVEGPVQAVIREKADGIVGNIDQPWRIFRIGMRLVKPGHHITHMNAHHHPAMWTLL